MNFWNKLMRGFQASLNTVRRQSPSLPVNFIEKTTSLVTLCLLWRDKKTFTRVGWIGMPGWIGMHGVDRDARGESRLGSTMFYMPGEICPNLPRVPRSTPVSGIDSSNDEIWYTRTDRRMNRQIIKWFMAYRLCIGSRVNAKTLSDTRLGY